MSWVGTMIGLPLAGDRMLLVDIIRTRASSWASRLSGTCTAIWSPSKSALKAVQTSGCSWMALPSISTGSNAWIPGRSRVGGGFQKHRIFADLLFEDVPPLRPFALYQPLGSLDGRGFAAQLQLREDERLE